MFVVGNVFSFEGAPLLSGRVRHYLVWFVVVAFKEGDIRMHESKHHVSTVINQLQYTQTFNTSYIKKQMQNIMTLPITTLFFMFWTSCGHQESYTNLTFISKYCFNLLCL